MNRYDENHPPILSNHLPPDRVRPRTVGEETPPEVLYHYTDSAGLLGMINPGRAWLTNAAYMTRLWGGGV
ncbi:hypothetical protein MYX82_14565 [Acidobacteria bacterium AH-259-D05]|nr:hypothetical protein [Acidobacteria bacterium AH-259-D05]